MLARTKGLSHHDRSPKIRVMTASAGTAKKPTMTEVPRVPSTVVPNRTTAGICR